MLPLREKTSAGVLGFRNGGLPQKYSRQSECLAKVSTEATYEAKKDFYIRTEATLRTLLTRAQAVQKNQEVADQIARIEGEVERIQEQHKRDGTLPQAVLNVDRGTLESEFRSFFTLELALKTHFGSQPSAAMAPATSP